MPAASSAVPACAAGTATAADVQDRGGEALTQSTPGNLLRGVFREELVEVLQVKQSFYFYGATTKALSLHKK